MSVAEAYKKMLEKSSCGSKKEAVQIDPDNGSVTKKKEKKDEKGTEKSTSVTEESEKLDPKAKGEKEFKDQHKVDIEPHPVAVHGKQDGAEKVKVASGRPGDNIDGSERKMKTLKDLRK
mgnify:CR=1 FL=1